MQTYCRVIMLADRHSLNDLKEATEKKMESKYKDICEKKEFLSDMNVDALSALLCRDGLRTPSENFVFKEVMQWIKYRKGERLDVAAKVIGAVRLGLVDSKDVIEELDTEEMKAIPEINMLLQEALIRNCRPSTSSALALEKGKPGSMNSVGEKVFKFARKRCRFPHLLHPALKKRSQEGKPIFLPFPKKSQGLERCLRWVNACGRSKDFTVERVTKYTYICYLHWQGEAGPTKCLKATLRPKEVLKATKPKRKAPLARHAVPSKRRKSGSNQDESHPVVDDYFSGSAEVIENSRHENDQEKSVKCRDFATQTDVSKHELSYKLGAMMMMKNAAKSRKSTNIVSNISYEVIKENSEQMKHFVGLTPEQFDVLYNFLNDVCPLHKISYWSYASKGKQKCDRATKSRVTNSISKWSSREKLYIDLLRLRTGFTIKT